MTARGNVEARLSHGLPDVQGRRAVVMGLGLFGGGVAAVRWLASRGARVTVTDLRDAEALATSVEALAGVDVRWRLGGHEPGDFDTADLVIVNPGVPADHPLLARAVGAGADLETEVNLFLRSCPATVVAVTGSNGKSTTSSLLAAMLAAGDRRVHLGGNIGRALVNEAASMDGGDVVVLEVSSFQLEWTARAGLRPDHAVVTNVMSNHLDRHGTYEAYFEAKRAAMPGHGGVLVAGVDDAGSRRLAEGAPVRTVLTAASTTPDGEACWWDGDRLLLRLAGEKSRVLLETADVPLRGSFNRENVAAAAAMASVLGVGAEALAGACRAFRGLPHRLEDCGELQGVTCINDSKATTPEAAMRALGAFSEPVVAIVGGSDKGADLGEFGAALAARCRAVVLLGATAGTLRAAVTAAPQGDAVVLEARSMEEAVRLGLDAARPGDVLLLSPGHASFGLFRNYEDRGDRFRAAVEAGRPAPA